MGSVWAHKGAITLGTLRLVASLAIALLLWCNRRRAGVGNGMGQRDVAQVWARARNAALVVPGQ